MITAALPNGISYSIPQSDVAFFQTLAKRMKWSVIALTEQKTEVSAKSSWVDKFADKWQDARSADQIVKDIHAARIDNAEIVL